MNLERYPREKTCTEPIHIISLGAGVQSSTMALMAAHGEITPMPKCAIFADTQAEPASVYRWLDWLEKQLPFPVYRVTKGDLFVESTKVYHTDHKTSYTRHSVPAFTFNDGLPTGMAMRQCTKDFKVIPLQRKMNKLRDKRVVNQWIGISIDEIYRMKEGREPWLKNRWPLVEKRMSRRDCLRWMQIKKYPKPPRSACVFCPFHNDGEWKRLKMEEAESFMRAVDYELAFQSAVRKGSGFAGTVFLHRSGKPLSEVDFSTEEERGQLNLFNNECTGLCGV